MGQERRAAAEGMTVHVISEPVPRAACQAAEPISLPLELLFLS